MSIRIPPHQRFLDSVNSELRTLLKNNNGTMLDYEKDVQPMLRDYVKFEKRYAALGLSLPKQITNFLNTKYHIIILANDDVVSLYMITSDYYFLGAGLVRSHYLSKEMDLWHSAKTDPKTFILKDKFRTQAYLSSIHKAPDNITELSPLI
jgi:hypothetical protein